MGYVDINKPAPDFTLLDLAGGEFQLSSFQGKKHVLLLLHRGFG